MVFWGRKHKVNVEDFCKDYYDLQVFQQHLRDSEKDKIWWKEAATMPEDVKSPDLGTDDETMQREFIALRLELFSLAWLRKFERANAAMRQSSFTRDYVGQQSTKGIWQTMGEYNSILGNPQLMVDTRGRPFDFRKLERALEQRLDVIDQWVKNGFDQDSVSRVANRIWVDDRVESRLYGLLAERLKQRLNMVPSRAPSNIESRLSPLPLRFYLAAKNDLSAVSLTDIKIGWF